ncbi:MAG: hypothetical protein U0Q18_16330 [Bryobacteraceae bacterium]
MRKVIGGQDAEAPKRTEPEWLDIARIAAVELSSEDPAFTIESAFRNESPGWRAGVPGEQRIRLIFDEPREVRRIRLRFIEHETERTQEFVLRSESNGASRETLRQQWNFSPGGSTVEVEDYTLDLHGVTALELVIEPDITVKRAIATLAEWRMAA